MDSITSYRETKERNLRQDMIKFQDIYMGSGIHCLLDFDKWMDRYIYGDRQLG